MTCASGKPSSSETNDRLLLLRSANLLKGFLCEICHGRLLGVDPSLPGLHLDAINIPRGMPARLRCTLNSRAWGISHMPRHAGQLKKATKPNTSHLQAAHSHTPHCQEGLEGLARKALVLPSLAGQGQQRGLEHLPRPERRLRLRRGIWGVSPQALRWCWADLGLWASLGLRAGSDLHDV